MTAGHSILQLHARRRAHVVAAVRELVTQLSWLQDGCKYPLLLMMKNSHQPPAPWELVRRTKIKLNTMVKAVPYVSFSSVRTISVLMESASVWSPCASQPVGVMHVPLVGHCCFTVYSCSYQLYGPVKNCSFETHGPHLNFPYSSPGVVYQWTL